METIHPWETAGLGRAPFRCIGVEHRVGPIHQLDKNGEPTGLMSGAPGQPMGTCDACGMGIADCYIIRSADRKIFVVGCDCVAKVGRDRAATPLERDVRRHRLALEHAKDDKRIRAARERFPSVREALTAQPHPYKGQRDRGMTLADWCEFMLHRAGRSGGIKAARVVERA